MWLPWVPNESAIEELRADRLEDGKLVYDVH